MCYTLGTSKKKCDRDFLEAMRRTCHGRKKKPSAAAFIGGAVAEAPCLAMAETYYADVATAKRHKSSWRNDQKWKNLKKGKKVYCVKF